MTRIRLAGLGLAAAVALFAPAVYAQSPTSTDTAPQPGWRHHGPGGPGDHAGMAMRGGLWSQLDLTDAQKAQLKQVRANHRDAITQLSQQVSTMHQQLHQAETGATFDEDLATKQLTAMASVEAKLMAERFKERQESEALLTDAQKARLQQLQEQMKARFASRHAGQPASNN